MLSGEFDMLTWARNGYVISKDNVIDRHGSNHSNGREAIRQNLDKMHCGVGCVVLQADVE